MSQFLQLTNKPIKLSKYKKYQMSPLLRHDSQTCWNPWRVFRTKKMLKILTIAAHFRPLIQHFYRDRYVLPSNYLMKYETILLLKQSNFLSLSVSQSTFPGINRRTEPIMDEHTKFISLDSTQLLLFCYYLK